MVGAVGLTIIVCLVSADGPATGPVDLSVVAIQATRESREKPFYDNALAPVRAALTDLDFDTYKQLKAVKVQAPLEEETQVKLDAKYTLCVTPLSRDKEGRIRMTTKVQVPPKKKEDKPVNVLSTTLVVAPGKPFKLRGLKLKEGEMVVVMAVKKAEGGKG